MRKQKVTVFFLFLPYIGYVTWKRQVSEFEPTDGVRFAAQPAASGPHLFEPSGSVTIAFLD